MALLFWFGLPVNIDARFFCPPSVRRCVPLAFVVRTRIARWNALLHASASPALVWILVGVARQSSPDRALVHGRLVDTRWAGLADLAGAVCALSRGCSALVWLALAPRRAGPCRS